jgi:hypothetical protein
MGTKIKFTRREIATALSTSAALLAQTPSPPSPQNAPLSPPLSPPQSPDDELKAARESNRQNSEQLAKFPLPMSTEPAARFKA